MHWICYRECAPRTRGGLALFAVHSSLAPTLRRALCRLPVVQAMVVVVVVVVVVMVVAVA